MSKKKNAEPTPQDYILQMEDDLRHLSTEKWLDWLESLQEELQIRIEMTKRDVIKDTESRS